MKKRVDGWMDGWRLVNQKVQMISEDEGRAPMKSGRWSR